MLTEKLHRFINKNSAKYYLEKDDYDRYISLTITTKNAAWIERVRPFSYLSKDHDLKKQLMKQMEARLVP